MSGAVWEEKRLVEGESRRKRERPGRREGYEGRKVLSCLSGERRGNKGVQREDSIARTYGCCRSLDGWRKMLVTSRM